MTPQEQRIQTKISNLARENLHRNCGVEIKTQGPHLGIYCANIHCKKTGSWISWISKSQAAMILRR